MAPAMTFDELIQAWEWRPIPNCPGRYRLTAEPPYPTVADLIGRDVEVQRFTVPEARDEVLVVRFTDGAGLISYRRPDGSVVHTLNTVEGFQRKRTQLGLGTEDA